MKVAEALPAYTQNVVAAFNDPEVAGPLDLRGEITTAHLERGQLPSFAQTGALHTVSVRVLAFVDDDRFRGVGVVYGWENPDDTIRELDVAMVGRRTVASFVEALVRLSDYCFKQLGALELRARVSEKRVGFDRVLRRIGSQRAGHVVYVDPHDGQRTQRVLYVLNPEAFYASPLVRRLGC